MKQASSRKGVIATGRPLDKPFSANLSLLYQQNAACLNRYGRWFIVAWLASLADSKLFLAIAASTLTYKFLVSGEQVPWAKLEPAYQQLCSLLSRLGQTPLLASSLAFATTYGFAAAWSQLGGSWAAITLLGLGAGNLLFFWREVNGRTATASPAPDASAETILDSSWDNLSSPAPLKRLLAVRSLLHWCLSSEEASATYLPGTDVTVRSHLVDCFRVMLTHESEPLVRVALIEGLKALKPKPQLSPGQPAMTPLKAKSPMVSAEVQKVVEYVEP